jgi:hypothetical protein
LETSSVRDYYEDETKIRYRRMGEDREHLRAWHCAKSKAKEKLERGI